MGTITIREKTNMELEPEKRKKKRKEYPKDVEPSNPTEKKAQNAQSKSAVKSSNEGMKNSNSKIALVIPWNGKIICPKHRQLLDYEGNLTKIENHRGSREKKEHEKNFVRAKIPWKEYFLWADASEIVLAQGDLNKLEKILPDKDKQRRNFRRKVSGKRSSTGASKSEQN